MVYLYDGTFEGLLTSVYYSYYTRPHAQKIYNINDYEPNFLDETKIIETDITKFEKVYNAIINKIGQNCLNKIYLVYLSEDYESANYIYRYLIMGFKVGDEINLHKNNDVVIYIDTMCKKVSNEKHRMKGFVRFKAIDNILISKINPTYNILSLLANHFVNRLTCENFIIYDEKRNLALVYNKSSYYITDVDSRMSSFISLSDDKLYENLWSEYFKSVNIPERKNTRAQKRMMPTRYWKNLVETQNL